MADSAENLTITIDDPDNSVHVDHDSGNVETKQDDGSVVVAFGAAKKPADQSEDDWFDNLVDDIDPMLLAKIANDLIDAIEADDRSREGYLATRARGLDLCGLELKEPKTSSADSSGVEGMSTVVNPLLLEAILKGWANAQAELLPASGPVKIKDDGEDETAQEDDEADALERDMNHYLTTTASEFYPDTSHMLLWGCYFGGSGFKKVYRCPMRRRPVSESVEAKDLIVSDTTKDLRSCGRVTHQIPMRPSVLKRMQLIKAYRDCSLTQPAPQPNAEDEKIAGIQGTVARPERPEDQPYTIWESQCELDLDQFVPGDSNFKNEGIPLPYLVSIEKDTRAVLAIRRDWDKEDEDAQRLRMYVKYPYVPGPGFYGTGMLNILGNSSMAMTIAWREALDAGEFASFPGGLIAKLGGRQNTSNLRVGSGTFMPIETNGLPIGQVVMGMPYRDVTPGLMAMIDKITQQAKEVGGVADIPAAEGIANVPVGTMLAQIEQATKVMAAAHKGMHTAMSEELELLLDLFRSDPEDFWRLNRVAPKEYWNEQKFLAAIENHKLVPVSDPNVPSHIHRIAKALALVQLIGMPAFAPYLDPKETLLRCLRAIHEDPNGIVIDPQPQAPGTSEHDAKVAQAQATVVTAQAKVAEAQAKLQSIPMQNQLEAEKLATERQVHAADLQRESIIHQGDMVKAAQDLSVQQRQHQLQAVKTVADLHQQQRAGALDAQQQQHDQTMDVAGHRLEVAKAAHDQRMDVAQHQLATRQADDAADQHKRDSEIAEKQAKQKAKQPAKSGDKK